MPKLSLIWQHLPLHFKRDVVGLLDFESRISLEVCSKSDRELVKSCPLHTKQILLEVVSRRDEQGLPFFRYHLYISFANVSNEKEVSFEKHSDAVTFLSTTLFAHRNATCQDFIFDNQEDEFTDRRLLKELQITFKHLKIKSLKFILNIIGNHELMLITDPSHLEKLTLLDGGGVTGNKSPIKDLMEQFKKVKSVKSLCVMEENVHFKIADFLSFEMQRLQIQKIDVSAEDLKLLIESFRSRTLPIHSCFHVKFPEIPLSQLRRQFADLSSDPHIFGIHFLSFPLKTDGLVLTVQWKVWDEMVSEVCGCVESIKSCDPGYLDLKVYYLMKGYD